MDYDKWVETVPQEITSDSLWKLKVYRLSLFVCDLGWQDVTKISKDKRLLPLSGQLYRALGSISANIAEGYSRGTGKDRARFYEYSLGSAREARDWYQKSRHAVDGDVLDHRMGLLSQIVRILLTMIPQQRGYTVSESPVKFERSLKKLLHDIPIL